MPGAEAHHSDVTGLSAVLAGPVQGRMDLVSHSSLDEAELPEEGRDVVAVLVPGGLAVKVGLNHEVPGFGELVAELGFGGGRRGVRMDGDRIETTGQQEVDGFRPQTNSRWKSARS